MTTTTGSNPGTLSLLELATKAIQNAADAHGAIAAYLVLLCDGFDWPAGIFYLVDPSAPRFLSATHQVHLREEKRTQALDLIARRPPGDDMQGLGGRVLDQGVPAWIEDVGADPNFKAAEFAKLLGLHGAFAAPIYIGGRLGAVAEFFSAEPMRPSPPMLSEIEKVGKVLGARLRSLQEPSKP